jgi:hypothetical protein
METKQVMLRQFQEELKMVAIMKPQIMLLPSHTTSSTFKLVDLMAILEDKVADTSTVYDTHGGEVRYSGKLGIRTKAGTGKFP